MAFSPSQKKNHIRELQSYLHALSFLNERIPRIIPDGFYGNETALAVRAFQREYGLPETGSTDYATWNKLVSVYRDYIHGNPAAYNIFPSREYVVREGDRGLLVYIIEAMLDDIGMRHDNMHTVNTDGSFNEDTARAVRHFQQRMGLPPDGRVDSRTWNMLVNVSEHLNRDMA